MYTHRDDIAEGIESISIEGKEIEDIYNYYRDWKSIHLEYKRMKTIGKALHYILSITDDKRFKRDSLILRSLKDEAEECICRLDYYPKGYRNAKVAKALGESIIGAINQYIKTREV